MKQQSETVRAEIRTDMLKVCPKTKQKYPVSKNYSDKIRWLRSLGEGEMVRRNDNRQSEQEDENYLGSRGVVEIKIQDTVRKKQSNTGTQFFGGKMN